MIPPIGDDPDPHADLVRKGAAAFGRGALALFTALMEAMDWILGGGRRR